MNSHTSSGRCRSTSCLSPTVSQSTRAAIVSTSGTWTRAIVETENGGELLPYRSVLEVINTETNRLRNPVYVREVHARRRRRQPLDRAIYVSNLPSATVTILS